MDINNEYAVLIFKLRRIVNCDNESTRKKLEKDYVKSLSAFKNRINAMESKIDCIATAAMEAKNSARKINNSKNEEEPKTIIFYGFKSKML